VVQRFGGRDWSLLTDRFYRRYLRREELEPAVELMSEVKKIFSTLASDEVDWGEGMQGDPDKTWLDARHPTLDLVFLEYFESFDDIVDGAIHTLNKYGAYDAVRLTLCSSIIIPGIEKMRPLEHYDALSSTDKPFWLQPEHEGYQFLGKDNPFLG